MEKEEIRKICLKIEGTAEYKEYLVLKEAIYKSHGDILNRWKFLRKEWDSIDKKLPHSKELLLLADKLKVISEILLSDENYKSMIKLKSIINSTRNSLLISIAKAITLEDWKLEEENDK